MIVTALIDGDSKVGSNEDDASRIIVGMPNHSIEGPFVIDKILSHLAGR